MEDVAIRTLRDPDGAKPFLPDYWLAWANGVQGDGITEHGAIANAKARFAAGEEADRAIDPKELGAGTAHRSGRMPGVVENE